MVKFTVEMDVWAFIIIVSFLIRLLFAASK